MEYKQAHGIAVDILKQLDPFTNFCSIAGSIRREKPEVKDIEIVCTPKRIEDKDMFGEIKGSHLIKGFIDIVNDLGAIVKGKPDGRMMQIQLPDGIMLDLFMPQEKDVIRQFAIRTESADYSHKVLAVSWNKKGWVGTDDGLRLEKECYKKVVGKHPDTGKDKFKHICNSKEPTLPPVWDNEYEFYKWLGLTWLEPQKRNV